MFGHTTALHVLVVNDDGPPNRSLSPYIVPFVNALNEAGHRTSVVLPTRSRSWIGKAHIIGEPLTATSVSPKSLSQDYEAMSSKHGGSGNISDEDWILVNGTPASCVQLGLFNLFPNRPPIDLVISGPNHGRNASTIYNLSSGTVGGALEAANCRHRSVALSFTSKDEQPAHIIAAACRHSVKLIEHLYSNWPPSVELFNINVPMLSDIERRPARYSRSLSSYWSKGSLYAETTHADPEHLPIKETHGGAKVRQFAWAPELSDIKSASASSGEGTDMWTINQGFTSITPLTANFSHVDSLNGMDIDGFVVSS